MENNIQPIKYQNSFVEEVEKYKTSTPEPTLEGFARHLGVTRETILSWANKKKKDNDGNLTEELARPTFLSAINNIEKPKIVQPKEKKEVVKKEEIQPEIKEEELNQRQELFCQLYATDREFFGNGVETYLEVYDIDKSKPNWYKTACAAASRLLSNVKVFERINNILEETGLNDSFVDKQLKFLITQHASFDSKLGAIKEYNKLKSRIVERSEMKVDATVNVTEASYQDIPNE